MVPNALVMVAARLRGRKKLGAWEHGPQPSWAAVVGLHLHWKCSSMATDAMYQYVLEN